ncbi:ParB N-terminal domain-containing protein [Ideonella sp. BN130291]|uniref:ParB N-terminal domain-containing protein n=1 Tax=Ideonella sp. BN130291 TaxID=3112940 RepID=UPI002E265B33|nr:ParB N-terminal domain-containing protein [Ideonella sp. BN130291]
MTISAAPVSEVAGYVVAIRTIEFFQATEQVDEDHVRQLARTIHLQGHWLAPMPIESSTGLVMDGNHRLQAARLLGLRRLPCIPLHYGDRRVAVRCWRSNLPFDTRRVLSLASGRELLPFKTTRHRFDPPLPQSHIPIALLA